MYIAGGEWRILHNKELCDIYISSSSAVSDKMREVAKGSIYR
jgi:hypothetical protein